MEQTKEGILRDHVNQLHADYLYQLNTASFQATIDTQMRWWKNLAAGVEHECGPDDPRIPLYRLFVECGAIPCPIDIYNTFAHLYTYERELVGTADDNARIQIRDVNNFGPDEWLLFTKSSGYALPKDHHYHAHVLLGFDVQLPMQTMLRIGDGKILSLGQDKLPSCVCSMRSCVPEIGENEWYANTTRRDGSICLYGQFF